MPILYNNILNGEEVLRSARDYELVLPDGYVSVGNLTHRMTASEIIEKLNNK